MEIVAEGLKIQKAFLTFFPCSEDNILNTIVGGGVTKKQKLINKQTNKANKYMLGLCFSKQVIYDESMNMNSKHFFCIISLSSSVYIYCD